MCYDIFHIMQICREFLSLQFTLRYFVIFFICWWYSMHHRMYDCASASWFSNGNPGIENGKIHAKYFFYSIYANCCKYSFFIKVIRVQKQIFIVHFNCNKMKIWWHPFRHVIYSKILFYPAQTDRWHCVIIIMFGKNNIRSVEMHILCMICVRLWSFFSDKMLHTFGQTKKKQNGKLF